MEAVDTRNSLFLDHREKIDFILIFVYNIYKN